MLVHNWNSHAISQLTETTKIGKYDVPATYVNVTQMCKACNKQFNDYARLDTTKAYWEGLSLETGIPVSNLVITIKGRGDKISQGTWTHPEIAIDCAQWVNVEFRIWANRALRQIISVSSVQQEAPPKPLLPIPTVDEIAQIIDLTLGRTDLDKNLIAGVKLNAIVKQHPQYAAIAETAKTALAVSVEAELLSPTQLGELMNPKLSARAVNKMLIEQGFQSRNPEGNPDYLPTEKGKPHSQMTLNTAKGRDKTVQHLRWFEAVLEILEVP